MTKLQKALPKKTTGKFLNYLLKIIKRLACYIKDERWGIAYNSIEYGVSLLVIGLENYMLCKL